MFKYLLFFSVFLITSCTTKLESTAIIKKTNETNKCDFSIKKTSQGIPIDLSKQTQCTQNQIQSLIIKHAPASFQTKSVNYALYRLTRRGYILYIANNPIPPKPRYALGNWTNNALYYIGLNDFGEFIRGSYVR